MATLLYEEMMEAVEELLLARIVANRHPYPEAEQKLIDWFASKGIELTIEGWPEYNARTGT